MSHPHSIRARTLLLAALVAPALLVAIAPPRAAAAQFDVTTTADAGPGSLRKALLDAAAAGGADTIVVQTGLGTITLSSELSWAGIAGTNPVTIEGNGVSVDFDGASRGFVDANGRGLTIHSMSITGVGGSVADDGAPVLSEGGPITLDLCNIEGNAVTTTAGDCAGAVLSEGGDITLSNCVIRGNTATSSADGAGAVLAEGGKLTVSDSTIESNVVVAGGNAGGAFDSEGGVVTLTAVIVACNQATHGGDGAGGLLSEQGAVTVTDSTFTGNSATSTGTDASANGILAQGVTPVLTNTTVSDDTSVCGGPAIQSYFLPKRIKTVFNTKHPEKSFLAAAGFIDTGPAVTDLTQPATLTVGGFTFGPTGLVPKGRNFKFVAPGLTFVIFPNPSGSSRAKFRLRTTGDLTGKIDPDAVLTMRFTQGAVDGIGQVKLGTGRYTIGRIRGALVAPNLYLVRSKATVKGAAKDSFAFVVGLATDGVTPNKAADVTVRLGNSFSATVPEGSFVRRGDKYVFKSKSAGISSVVIDYLRETISVAAKKINLGAFVTGGQGVRVSVELGVDRRDVLLRMVKKGRNLRY